MARRAGYPPDISAHEYETTGAVAHIVATRPCREDLNQPVGWLQRAIDADQGGRSSTATAHSRSPSIV